MNGWKCPVCGRGVNPSEKTCNHGPENARPINPAIADHWPPLPTQDGTGSPPQVTLPSTCAVPMPGIGVGTGTLLVPWVPTQTRSFGVLHGQPAPWRVN